MNTTEEYFKQVLTKVSFDQDLFMKVLCEILVSLEESELNEMKSWCLSEFGPDCTGIIRSCFGELECPENKKELQTTCQDKLFKN